MQSLTTLGWNGHLQQSWKEMAMEQCVPGRVIAEYGSSYKVAIPGELSAEISGRLEYQSLPQEMPKVGDWVAVQLFDEGRAVIHAVLPRKSEIGRKQAGEQVAKQILATNVDIAFVVQALDHDFSPERIQRYLFQLSKEGIESILVLNKADKEPHLEAKIEALRALNAQILVTSAAQNSGVDQIADAIQPGKTAIFLGSSGVGKSTLTNALLGEDRQTTQAVRETDSKGRHTTSHRELFILPGGGLIIDTPGIRELQLWGMEEDLTQVFTDIEGMAKQCKFSNCSHESEPGCAVMQAVVTGKLDKIRLESYFKFQKELRYLNTKVDSSAALDRKQGNKKSQKLFNQIIRDENEDS